MVLSSARGHTVRLLLTAFSVMLGVSFVAGTFVLRDSMDTTLTDLLSNSAKGVDVEVRGFDTGTAAAGDSRATLPLTLGPTIAAVDGVAQAVPDLTGTALIAGRDGTAVGGAGGAPHLGFAYRPKSPAFTLVDGRAPTGPEEVVVERTTLERSGLAVGDTTTAVVGGATRPVTITGEVTFGALFGATAVLVDEATALAAFAPDGTVATFSVTAADGVSQRVLRDRLAAVLPPAAEAVTGDDLGSEVVTEVQDELGFFTTFLLVFAGVALFVGSFIIVNTFSMLVAQRARELGLLRALGASRGQVLGLVLGEAAVVGVVGSGLGLGLGLLVAAGAQAAITWFLGASAGTGLPVGATTVVLSLAVGTVVTVVAAALPAWRASRTTPVSAMRADPSSASDTPSGLRRRGTTGGLVLLLGVTLLGNAVTRTTPAWGLAGGGALLAVLGMLVAAPVATRPVVRVVAWPFVRLGGVVGRLARESALRVPRRTAATAGALMIGLALVAGLSVLAQSVKASVSAGVGRELVSDYVLAAGTAGVPAPVAPAVEALPGVASVARVAAVGVRIGSFTTYASATTADGVAANFLLPMSSGSLDTLTGDTVLVDRTTATAQGWAVGDVVEASVGTIGSRPLTIGGVYEDSQAFGSHLLVDRALYEAAVPATVRADTAVFVRARAGTDLTALRADLVGVAKPYVVVSVQDRAEFTAATVASVDTLLALLYVLLLFSIVVAVLGVVNTLGLSVYERTREIGLLRAVGLRRRQLTGMITIEAVATAVFGAVLGTALGLGLGIALQRGLQAQGLTVLAVPWGTVVVLIVSSAVVGVLAAVLPSVRATRLDVLTAIATDA